MRWSIYDIGTKIRRNKCKSCGVVPNLTKEDGLWRVQCPTCGSRSPHSKYAYKAVFQWNMSRHSTTPHFLEIPMFADCHTLSQAERVLANEIRKQEHEWKCFMEEDRNRRRRGMKRTYLNLIKEQLLYYKWLLDYWKKEGHRRTARARS